MGGTLAVQSEEGCGSCFSFELLLQPSAVQPAPIDLTGRRVMVATRCAHHRRAAELHLSHAGAEVEFIDHLEVLLELFRNPSLSPPNLLVLEASFFEGSQCRGVVERCLGLGRDTVCVALLAPCAASGSSLELPGVSHLYTPLSPSELLECAHGPTPGSRAFECLTVARRALEEATGGVRIHLLLVEDNPINQRVGQRTLERLGCSVRIATNGNEALEMTEREEFDLVLMDCQMPEMDGYQATAAIRERDAREGWHTPVVALTAHARPEDRQRCLDAGMDDHLAKPADALRLAEMVARYAKPAERRRAG